MRGVWLVAVLLAPTVAAGSGEHPELRDATGDAVTGLAAGDIQAAWLENVAGGLVRATLQVARHDPVAAIHLLLGFGPWMVAAELMPERQRFFMVDSYDGTSWVEGPSIEGRIRGAAPAWVEWDMPRADLGVTPLSAWYGVWARSWAVVHVDPPVDEAEAPQSVFQSGIASFLTSDPGPAREADYEDAEGDGEGGFDLRSVWVDFGETSVDITLSIVQTLQPDGTGPLAVAHVHVIDPRTAVPEVPMPVEDGVVPLPEPGLSIIAGVFWRPGPNGTGGLELVQPWLASPAFQQRVWGNVTFGSGSPAWVRWSAPRAWWNGTQDPRRLVLNASVGPRLLRHDEFRHDIDLEPEGVPGPDLVATLAVAGCVAVRRCRLR